MKFQKLTALFLSTAITVGLLAGCSSGGSGSSTTQTPLPPAPMPDPAPPSP